MPASSEAAQRHPEHCGAPVPPQLCREGPARGGAHPGSSQKPSSIQVPAVWCRRSFTIPGVSISSLHEAVCCYCLLLSIHLVAIFSLSKLCLISPFPPFPPYFLGATLSATHLSTLINYSQPMIGESNQERMTAQKGGQGVHKHIFSYVNLPQAFLPKSKQFRAVF